MKKFFYINCYSKLNPDFLRWISLSILIILFSKPSFGQLNHLEGNGEILRIGGTGTSPWMSFHNTAGIKSYIWQSGDNLRLRSYEGDILLESLQVGIGTTSPVGKVEIAHNSSVGNPHLYLNEAGTDFARITMRNGTGNAFWDIAGCANCTTPQLNMYYNNGSGTARNYLRILPSVSNFEIWGDLTPQDVSFDLGNNNATEHWDDCVADDFINFSDRRLKEGIQSLASVLPDLLKLAPVSYKYIESFNPDNRQRVGLIAQDVLKVFPSIVIDEDIDIDVETHQRRSTKSEYLSMNYIELIPIVIKGIQEQQQIIGSQKAYIDELESKIIPSLMDRLTNLEKSSNHLNAVTTTVARN